MAEKEQKMNENLVDTQTELRIAEAELKIIREAEPEELEEALRKMKNKYGI